MEIFASIQAVCEELQRERALRTETEKERDALRKLLSDAERKLLGTELLSSCVIQWKERAEKAEKERHLVCKEFDVVEGEVQQLRDALEVIKMGTMCEPKASNIFRIATEALSKL